MTATANTSPPLAWTLPAGVTFDSLPALPSQPTSAPPPPGADSSFGSTVVDAALTFATFASFAAGPLGTALAGTFAAINIIFNSSEASDADAALVISITDYVQQAIDAEAVREAAATISSFSAAYHDMTLPVLLPYLSGLRPIPPDLSATSDPTLNQAWTTFVEEVTAAGPFLDAITTLQQPDGVTSGVNIQVQGFQTFLAGAGFHLYLLATYVALENGCPHKRPDPAVLARLTNTANRYAAYAVTIVNYINSQFSARYSAVSGVLNSAMSVPPIFAFGMDGPESPTFFNGFSFTDTGTPAVPSSWNPDALDTSGNATYDPNTVYFIGDITPNAAQTAATELQAYLGWVASVMVNQYMVSPEMLTVIAKMQATASPNTASSS